jgi:transposase
MSYIPLTTPHWAALAPHLARTCASGRPLENPRARFDALLAHGATARPWREAAPDPREAATLARHFRRLTHAGLWERLLRALAAAAPEDPLRSLEAAICRAARRAYRLRGLALLLLARRLKLRRALPGPPWMLPDPDLSETLSADEILDPSAPPRGGITAWRKHWQALRRLRRNALGRRYVRRSLRLGWC